MNALGGAFGIGALVAAAALSAWPADVPVDKSLLMAKSQSDYLLGCGGCHGAEGRTNSKLVPDLKNQVGYFLSTPGGREYLVRLPNVAFNTASNQELAGMLNYMVYTVGGGMGVPANAKPYSAAEVARLRKAPLTEVSLVDYRARLVEDLILHHHAPESLRLYGNTAYER